MSLEEFKIIAKKLKGVTEYLYLHILGEPLCHPDLINIISYARAEGFKVCLTTNGTLLSLMGDKLIKAGVYKVSISLHSFEDGTGQEYDTYINSCIEFADKSSKKGILTVFRLWNKGFDNGRNKDITERLKNSLCGEWKEGRRGIRIRDKLHLECDERFSWPDMSADFIGDDVFCYGLKDHFGILCDGRVVPCCLDREGVITLGNIFESSLEDILKSKRATDLRQGFKNRKATEELCKKCGYAKRF